MMHTRLGFFFPSIFRDPNAVLAFPSNGASTMFIRELLVTEGSDILCFRYPV